MWFENRSPSSDFHERRRAREQLAGDDDRELERDEAPQVGERSRRACA